jgi:hypothetical protein
VVRACAIIRLVLSRRFWLPLLAAIAMACNGPAPPPQELSDEEVARLLALGYLDEVPGDAQEEGGAVVHDEALVQPGYTLYVVRALCEARLIDLQGQIVHSWRQKGDCGYWSNAELFENHEMGVTAKDGWLRWYDWEGRLMWEEHNSAHHDQEIAPDGRIALLIGLQRDIDALSRWRPVRDNYVTLLDRDTHEIVERISLYDTLSQNTVGFSFLDRRAILPLRWLDVFHANSVEFVHAPPGADTSRGSPYEAGNVLVSVRNQDSAVIINIPRKELVWAWGQGQLSGPHDASMLADGQVMIFDNGVKNRRSRVLVVDPRTHRITWLYDADGDKSFYTRGRGSAQRLPNGNTLIASSDQGWVFEVTDDGEIVWEYRNPKDERGKRPTIVRAKRYDTEWIEARLLRE